MRKIFTICIAIFVLSQVSYSRIYQKVNYDKIEKELNYSKLVVKLNNIVNYDILFEITEKYKIEFYNYFKLKPKSELLFTKQFQDKQGIEILIRFIKFKPRFINTHIKFNKFIFRN